MSTIDRQDVPRIKRPSGRPSAVLPGQTLIVVGMYCHHASNARMRQVLALCELQCVGSAIRMLSDGTILDHVLDGKATDGLLPDRS